MNKKVSWQFLAILLTFLHDTRNDVKMVLTCLSVNLIWKSCWKAFKIIYNAYGFNSFPWLINASSTFESVKLKWYKNALFYSFNFSRHRKLSSSFKGTLQQIYTVSLMNWLVRSCPDFNYSNIFLDLIRLGTMGIGMWYWFEFIALPSVFYIKIVTYQTLSVS